MSVCCPNCGKQLPDGARFCRDCGMKISSAASPNDKVSDNSETLPSGKKQRKASTGVKKRKSAKKHTGNTHPKKRQHQGIRLTTILVVLLFAAALGSSFGLYRYLTKSDVAESGMTEEVSITAEAAEEETVTVDFSEADEIVIVDEETALNALDAVKSHFGISDTEEEYQFVSSLSGTYCDVYWFRQYYDDIWVYGYSLKVICDKSGNLTDVAGEYVQLGEIDTSYQIKADDVSKYVVKYMENEYDCSEEDVEITEQEKIILVIEEEEAQTAYVVDVSITNMGQFIIFVDGNTGNIIAEQDGTFYDSVSMTLAGQQESHTVSLAQIDDENYYIYDEERNIAVYYDHNNEMLTVESGTVLSDIQKGAVDALYYAGLAQDFYSDVLGWDTEDMLHILVDYVEYKNGSQLYDNAGADNQASTGGGLFIVIVPKSSDAVTYSCYENVLAHEYTHLMIDYVTDLGAQVVYDRQCSTQYAIGEALADIMAEFSEDYNDDGILNDSCDWNHNPSRNIADAESDASLLTQASSFVDGTTDCHDGSTILSYAAYLMNQGLTDKGYDEYDQLSTSQMAILYYDTILQLTEGTTFTGFRSQLERIAIEMNMSGELTDDELETVIDSMDYVGISSILANYRVAQGGSLTILGADGEVYDRCKITIEKGLGGETVVDNMTLSSGVYTLPYSIEPGYYWVTLTDLENTGLTESFYLLVNDNCEMNADKIEEYPSSQEIKTDFGAESREVVLVLDISDSMSGSPISDTRTAAEEFVSSILEESPGASISIVVYGDDASVLVESSSEESELNNCIQSISCNGGTNLYAGLLTAQSILASSDAEQKVIVLMSDGLPNRGTDSGGDYTIPVINLAADIKEEDTVIYALGFFGKLSGSDLSDGISLMKQVASEGYYYNLSNDDIQDVFADMASLVNGSRYYNITLACPVEVSITYKGETLSSSEDLGETRTTFGSVSFEGEDEDDQTKVVRLLYGYEYEICIYGTGTGTMNYTISVPDEDGNYTDVRTFDDVSITEQTRILTNTDTDSSTLLEVDSDGDGTIDLYLIAGKNGTSEQLSVRILRYLKYILLVVCLAVLLTLIVRIPKRYRRNKYCEVCGTAVSKKAGFCPKCGTKKERVPLLLPKKREPGPHAKAARRAKAVVCGICILLIGFNLLVVNSDATKVYDRIRDHELESALWLYDGSVSESLFAKTYLSGLLVQYVEDVQTAYEDGQISKLYAEEVCQTMQSMDLKEVSELAESCLESMNGSE